MIFSTDKYNNENLIKYASVKSRRVIRSVLGADMFALEDACDAAILLQHDLNIIINKTLKISLLTDSATIFNFIIRNAPTTENASCSTLKQAEKRTITK